VSFTPPSNFLAPRSTDLAIDMMRPGSISYAPYIPPTGTPTVVAIEASTMLEAQTRTLWMLYIGDCSAAANGRPRHLSDVEMAEIMLPGDEAAWQRWGGFDVTSRAIGRPTIGSRYLGIDARPIVPEEASRDGAGLGEFAHVLRIVSPSAGSFSSRALQPDRVLAVRHLLRHYGAVQSPSVKPVAWSSSPEHRLSRECLEG
jgi:hypothetical protein